MTDSDIIQALECCRKNERESSCAYCRECPASNWDLKNDEDDCIDSMNARAIKLIKRQQEEIERLEGLATNMEYCANHALDEIEKEKREAIKDFAERLKEKAYTAENEWSRGGHPLVVEVDDIDEVVEEMEDENGRA